MLVNQGLILVSLMSTHSSWVLRPRAAEQDRLSLGGQGSATLPGSKCLLSKGEEWEVGKDSDERKQK